MLNSEIRVNNLIASGNKFSDTSVMGIVRTIHNTDVDFEQIEIEGEDFFSWFFKDNYCGIPVKNCLLEHAGFMKHKSSLTTSFSINISRFDSIYKVISITLEPGNQYIYIREGETDKREEDSIITIFNGDIDGEIYFHHIQNLYFVLTGKELEIDIEKITEYYYRNEI
jgi:hypothetical protein